MTETQEMAKKMVKQVRPKGEKWHISGTFRWVFITFFVIFCSHVDLMHVKFQFCQKNQSNSFVLDAGALFQSPARYRGSPPPAM